ncbi:hypothetical protein [Rhodohalobacter sp. SW132]|nr:hypothetical protein [Rhodohalobacter sp. SW132]
MKILLQTGTGNVLPVSVWLPAKVPALGLVVHFLFQYRLPAFTEGLDDAAMGNSYAARLQSRCNFQEHLGRLYRMVAHLDQDLTAFFVIKSELFMMALMTRLKSMAFISWLQPSR